MWKLYKTNREVQIEWMRDNPGKVIALNALFGAAILGYIWYQDRKDRQEFDKNFPPQEPASDSPSEN